jgi:DNA-binding CsgD family transcriptional regulator
MIHLLSAVFFSVCSLGLANAILAFLVYKRQNEKLYKYQFLFLAAAFLYSVSQFIALYSFSERLIQGYFLMPLLSNSLMSPLLYFAFLFTYQLAGVKPSKISNPLMIGWALFYPLVFILWLWKHIVVFYTIFYAYSPFFILFVILIVLLRRYRKIAYPEVKKFIRNILALIALFIPLIILETFVHRYLKMTLYYSYPVTQLFFLGFNIVNLSFLIRVFLKSPSHTHTHTHTVNPVLVSQKLPPWFYEKYDHTKREQEVLSLLQQRYGNREIANKLYISVPTVKYHIQNIFLKTGVNNRVKLLQYLEKILITNS